MVVVLCWAYFLYFSIFVVIPVLFGIVTLRDYLLCTEQITGTYVGNTFCCMKGITNCLPKFKYTYKGKEYEEFTDQSCTPQYLENNFALGESYDIFIDKEDPSVFVFHKKKSEKTKAVFFFGIAAVFLGLFVFLVIKNIF